MSSLLELYLRAPDAEALGILKFILGLVLLLHLPYLGLLVGSTLLSVLFNLLGVADRRAYFRLLAKDLVDTAVHNFGIMFALGFLPIPAIVLIYAQILFSFENSSTLWLSLGGAFMFLTMVVLYIYKATFSVGKNQTWLNLYSGVIGLVLLLATTYHFFAASSLLIYPEKWPFIHDPSWMMFTSNALIRMGLFVFASIGLSAAFLLFVSFRWPDTTEKPDEAYTGLLTYVLGGAGLGATLALPVFFLWDMIMVQTYAKDQCTLIGYVTGAVVAMIIGQSFISLIRGKCYGVSVVASFLFLVLFGTYVSIDHSSREFAIQEYTKLLSTRAAEAAAVADSGEEAMAAEAQRFLVREAATPELRERLAKIRKNNGISDEVPAPAAPATHGHDAAPAAPAADHAAPAPTTDHSSAAPADAAPAHAEAPAAAPAAGNAELAAKGKKLVTIKGCASCHSSDGSKIVGPTFKGLWASTHKVTTDGAEREITVDLEYLTRAINQPNADVVVGFPPVMPAQGLSDEEVQAVAAYLQTLSE